jgi:hypothetical protein
MTEKAEVAMRAAWWVFGGVVAVISMGRGAQAQALGPACALMSQATAAMINGAPVSAGQEQDDPGESNECTFNGSGNNGTVSVTVDPPSTVIANSDVFKTAETTPNPGMTVTVLSGIGDGAYFSQNGQDFDLWVLVGQKMLDVSAVQPQGAVSALQAAMTAAAKTALKGM